MSKKFRLFETGSAKWLEFVEHDGEKKTKFRSSFQDASLIDEDIVRDSLFKLLDAHNADWYVSTIKAIPEEDEFRIKV